MSDNIFYKPNFGKMPAISLCNIADVKPPYIHFRRKSHEYILYFILTGELHIREDSREYLLTRGDYILLDPEWEHEGLHSTTCRFIYIHFSTDGISRCDDLDTPLLFPKSGQTESVSGELNPVLYRLLDCIHDDVCGNYMMSSLLCEVLGILANCHRQNMWLTSLKNSQAGSNVQNLKYYLSRHYYSDMDSVSLEEKYHCNFDYLNRIFKKETGDTIFSALNNIRIENAKKYLATGLYTCSEVAMRCGFHDVYYFSKVFKKHVGIPPAAYKAANISEKG